MQCIIQNALNERNLTLTIAVNSPNRLEAYVLRILIYGFFILQCMNCNSGKKNSKVNLEKIFESYTSILKTPLNLE